MRSIVIVFLLLNYQGLIAQSIQRRADLGARISSPSGQKAGATVREVTANSALYKAGLRAGDLLLKLDNEVIKDPDRWSDILYDLRGGQSITLTIQRQSEFLEIPAKLDALPREQFKGVDIRYDVVVNDNGEEIRTILSKPSNVSGRQPAIFLIGGLSCSSIEVYPGRPVSGWTRVLQDLITKSGMVFMRVEKPGVGDSNGACGCSDFKNDISAFESALKSLYSISYVDTNKVIIYGSSMGSALAPVLANKFNAAGIIADGTFVKTWFEHMLEIERRIRKFQGDTPEEITRKINEIYIPLYYGMLIEKKTYAQVINEKPWLAPYNYHSAAHMYGRPVRYYHQVQDFNFAKGWQELKVPARIIRGTNDWIMSDIDNEMILEILESNGHADHQLYRYPGLDHWNMIHKQAADSFHGASGEWEDNISQIIIDYAWEMAGK